MGLNPSGAALFPYYICARMTTMATLTCEEGLCVGVSSGANVWASKQIASKLGEDKNVVTVLPDTDQRYLDDIYWSC